MPQPRKSQVCITDTPYYHCISRCVRRAYLCGHNSEGNSFEHRRRWLEDRIRLLSSVFAVYICSYAVMSNHYHIVIKLASTAEWSDEQVIRHWLTLHKGPLLVRRLVAGEVLGSAERKTISETVNLWRGRLQNLSWFMKCLNEPIARAANKEDNCTGHFWESRFISQPLLTEEALISCMAYVDLNPIRANMADTPETSDHTSIKERITHQFDLAEAIKEQNLPNGFTLSIKPLLHFEDSEKNTEQNGVLFSLPEYLQLVDWTGRAIRNDKRGYIGQHEPPILSRLNIPPEDWLQSSQHFEALFKRRFKHAA